MFFKIIINNQIIDVGASTFKAQKKPHILVECDASECEYVASATTNRFYYSSWTVYVENPFSFAEQVDVIKPIEENEYNELLQQLADNTPIAYKKETNSETSVIIEELEEKPEVLDTLAMKRKILELEALVQQLLNK